MSGEDQGQVYTEGSVQPSNKSIYGDEFEAAGRGMSLRQLKFHKASKRAAEAKAAVSRKATELDEKYEVSESAAAAKEMISSNEPTPDELIRDIKNKLKIIPTILSTILDCIKNDTKFLDIIQKDLSDEQRAINNESLFKDNYDYLLLFIIILWNLREIYKLIYENNEEIKAAKWIINESDGNSLYADEYTEEEYKAAEAVLNRRSPHILLELFLSEDLSVIPTIFKGKTTTHENSIFDITTMGDIDDLMKLIDEADPHILDSFEFSEINFEILDDSSVFDGQNFPWWVEWENVWIKYSKVFETNPVEAEHEAEVTTDEPDPTPAADPDPTPPAPPTAVTASAKDTKVPLSLQVAQAALSRDSAQRALIESGDPSLTQGLLDVVAKLRPTGSEKNDKNGGGGAVEDFDKGGDDESYTGGPFIHNPLPINKMGNKIQGAVMGYFGSKKEKYENLDKVYKGIESIMKQLQEFLDNDNTEFKYPELCMGMVGGLDLMSGGKEAGLFIPLKGLILNNFSNKGVKENDNSIGKRMRRSLSKIGRSLSKKAGGGKKSKKPKRTQRYKKPKRTQRYKKPKKTQRYKKPKKAKKSKKKSRKMK